MIKVLISMGMAVIFAVGPNAVEPQAKQQLSDRDEAVLRESQRSLEEARKELDRISAMVEKEQAARAYLNRNLPKGWTAHEFNGQPVYFILCGQEK